VGSKEGVETGGEEGDSVGLEEGSSEWGLEGLRDRDGNAVGSLVDVKVGREGIAVEESGVKEGLREGRQEGSWEVGGEDGG